MKSKVLLFLVTALLIVCLNFRGMFLSDSKIDKLTVNSLETQGYSNVQIVSRDIWWRIGGERGDSIKVAVVAVNPAGKKVKVNLFSKWPFGGNRVRTD